jgi:Tfp pilus assembly protein PilF
MTAASVRDAFTSRRLSHWHPLTWLSYQLDVQLFGMAPATFHRTNVALHMANAVLVFLVLRAMTRSRWRSALAAAIFAVHPLRVESVAWIAERKDVLSMLVGLLCMLAWAGYVRRNSWVLYVLSIALFGLCLMAKPMLVTLPAVLLLLDYWPLARLGSAPLRRIVMEKLPLVALSAASCAITLRTATGTGAVQGLARVPLEPRIASAVVAHVEYLIDMFWPAKLVVLYPFEMKIPPGTVFAAAGVLIAITVASISLRGRLPNLIVGWLWFLGVLFPVNGLVSIGELSRADRYTYFPMIGVLLMVIWSIPAARTKLAARIAAGASVAVVLVFALLSRRQLQYWRDSPTLFARTLDVIGPQATIHMNYGAALAAQKKSAEAVEHYREAWRLRPTWSVVVNNLGNELYSAGKVEEAIGYYREALRLDRKQPMTWFNMGIAYMRLDRWADAEAAYRQALQLVPDFAPARNNLAFVLDKQGKSTTQP